MDSPIVAAFIRSALVPAVLATVAIGLAGFLREPWKARLQALILACAFMVGAYVLIGRLSLPPRDAAEALSLSALLLAVFVVARPHPLGHRYLLRAIFVLALGVLILWPLRNTITAPQNQRNLIAFFCLSLGVWSIVEKAATKVRPLALIVLPLIAATSLSLMMLFASSASYSQLVSVACACFGGLLAIALFMPSLLSVNALVPFLSVFIIIMMVAGHFYLDINPWHMIYLCFPYLILWIRDWLGFVPQKPIPEAIILGAIGAAPMAYFVYNVGVKAGPLY